MKMIDPVKLSRQGADLEGEIPIAAMPRLQELLLDSSGNAHYDLSFTSNESGKRSVEGRICAAVVLQCQRCNQAVTVEVEVEPRLQVVLNDAQAQNTQEGYEPLLLEEGVIALAELIEEEILLALPMIAKHESGKCPASLPDYLH
jgi:uncharacterized protein